MIIHYPGISPLSRDRFNQSGLANGKIAPAVLSPSESKVDIALCLLTEWYETTNQSMRSCS